MESYFSIDDILSSESRVYATLQVPAHRCAHLDPTGAQAYWAAQPAETRSQHENLPAGHRLALPFWLVESLTQRGIVSLQLPFCYGTQARHCLRADATAVRLDSRCPSFYSLGVRLAGLVRDVGLADALVRAFAARCWGVVDSGMFRGYRGVQALLGLEERERRLFFAAHGLELAIRRWKERLVDVIGKGGSVLGKRAAEEVGSPVTPAAQKKR